MRVCVCVCVCVHACLCECVTSKENKADFSLSLNHFSYAELSDSQFEAAINSETDLPPEVTGLQTPNKENT